MTQWAIKDLAVTDQLLEITGPSWDSGVGQAADRSREKRPIHVLDEVAEGCIGRRSPEPILQSHCVDAVIAEVKAPQIQQALVAAQDPEHRNDQQGSVRDADAPSYTNVLVLLEIADLSRSPEAEPVSSTGRKRFRRTQAMLTIEGGDPGSRFETALDTNRWPSLTVTLVMRTIFY